MGDSCCWGVVEGFWASSLSGGSKRLKVYERDNKLNEAHWDGVGF